jgi:hypothetical protein
MNLKRRIASIEKVVPLDEDDGPAMFTELISGTIDREYRRKIGPRGVREGQRMMRELVERFANYDPSLDILEGDDRSDLEPPRQSSENQPLSIECGIPENLGDIRK